MRLRDGTLFQVGKSTERRAELLQRFRRVLLFNVLSVFVGLAGGAVLTSSALQPVRALAETVRGILRTGRTTRACRPDTGDALGELSALVNAMLDRIDAVVAGMRGALDNVAHDLRTPMARLRGIAETALASERSGALRDALADCLEESDRIIAMLNTLMDISEAETGTMALRREPADLDDWSGRRSSSTRTSPRSAASSPDERTGGARRRCRSQPDPAGARQPARQRDQVHAGGRAVEIAAPRGRTTPW